MANSDPTAGYSTSVNDFTDSDHLWRRAFREIQPILSILAARKGNETLAKAYATAVKESENKPHTWSKTGWRVTLAEALGKQIDLTQVESWDWPLTLYQPSRYKPLQTLIWSVTANPNQLLHLIWVKNSYFIAASDDRALLPSVINNEIRLKLAPPAEATPPIHISQAVLRLWIWGKHNFTLRK